ncbi:MAG: hypothetical protein DLM59_00400 [Pseudonocardiales bacterium]|nr:MAG: hypothetical protein DLM59_00400 [Pseudonocardiales bacterium]
MPGVLVVAALAAVLVSYGPAAATTAPAADPAGRVSMIAKSASRAFPTGQRVGTPKGIENPELLPEEREQADKAGVHPPPTSLREFAVGGLQPPSVAPSAVGGSAGLDRSWHGLDGFDTRYANGGNQASLEPPDQALCVGNAHVLEAVNSAVRVYTTSGTAATPVTDLNSFYGYPAQIDRTTGVRGPFTFDPTCVFDQGTGRFYLVVDTAEVDPKTGAFLGPNHLDLAVSGTGDPTGAWDIFRLPVQDDGSQGTPTHPGCPCVGDYPHIGFDANAIFLTTNEATLHGPGVFGGGNGAQIYALDKRALAAGSSQVRVVQFENTFLPSGAGKVPGFTVWPAQVPDSRYNLAGGGTEYLLSSIATLADSGMADQIGVWAVTNTASITSSAPDLRLQRGLVDSEVYGVPPMSSQQPGPVPLRDCLTINCQDVLGPGARPAPGEAEGPLASQDGRMQQVYYSGGVIYGALDTVIQVRGNLQAGIAWFAVRPGATAAASTVARQGYLGLAGNNVTYPALAVLPNGTGVMAFTLVGASHYPSAAYSRFGPSGPGPVQIAAAGRAPQDGNSEYSAFHPGHPARPRWGDYGAAATNGSAVFTASEYIGSKCSFAQFQADSTCGGTRAPLINWGTRISRVTP